MRRCRLRGRSSRRNRNGRRPRRRVQSMRRGDTTTTTTTDVAVEIRATSAATTDTASTARLPSHSRRRRRRRAASDTANSHSRTPGHHPRRPCRGPQQTRPHRLPRSCRSASAFASASASASTPLAHHQSIRAESTRRHHPGPSPPGTSARPLTTHSLVAFTSTYSRLNLRCTRSAVYTRSIRGPRAVYTVG